MQVHMFIRNAPLIMSRDAYIVVNRVLYVVLCVSLWSSAIFIRKFPKPSALLLLVAIPLMYLDGSGSYFDLSANMLHIAEKNPSFDHFYNDLKVTEHLWQFSLLVVIAGFIVGLRSRGATKAANNSFKADASGAA